MQAHLGNKKAKILRMTYDPDGAISVLKDGLRPERPGHFVQADALVRAIKSVCSSNFIVK